MKPLLLALACALLGAPIAAAQAAHSLRIDGFGKTATLTAVQIAALPHVSVVIDQEGAKRTYEGVPVSRLLAEVGAPSGGMGAVLANAVVVTSRDGYAVVLSLAETDPATRKDRAILADRVDGRPLSERDGPYRLVVEGDLRASRFARQVASISVKPVSSP